MELWTSYLIPLDFSFFKPPAQEWRMGGLVQVGGQNASQTCLGPSGQPGGGRCFGTHSGAKRKEEKAAEGN